MKWDAAMFHLISPNSRREEAYVLLQVERHGVVQKRLNDVEKHQPAAETSRERIAAAAEHDNPMQGKQVVIMLLDTVYPGRLLRWFHRQVIGIFYLPKMLPLYLPWTTKS